MTAMENSRAPLRMDDVIVISSRSKKGSSGRPAKASSVADEETLAGNVTDGDAAGGKVGHGKLAGLGDFQDEFQRGAVLLRRGDHLVFA